MALQGDVTVRFLLKVLVVFLVIGAGFLHFLADLWGYWGYYGTVMTSPGYVEERTTLLINTDLFEAQTFSNFFRFPMIFLCGLFFPVAELPAVLRPLSYALPLTYGADALHAGFRQQGRMPLWLDFLVLIVFCLGLFLVSLHNIRRKWIV